MHLAAGTHGIISFGLTKYTLWLGARVQLFGVKSMVTGVELLATVAVVTTIELLLQPAGATGFPRVARLLLTWIELFVTIIAGGVVWIVQKGQLGGACTRSPARKATGKARKSARRQPTSPPRSPQKRAPNLLHLVRL